MSVNHEESLEVKNQERNQFFPDFKSECIIADKVYAHCQERECFEQISVNLPEGGSFEFVDIAFNPGEIVLGSLAITPIANRPNFSRVKFKVLITNILRARNRETGAIIMINNELPEIHKDIVLFIPEARDEFKFQIGIETASQMLTEPIKEEGVFVFAVGVFIVIKVIGRVQLLVPVFGFCPEPPECEEFSPEDARVEFETAPFPEFFPQFDEYNFNELL
ncbi:hypothetical protein [Alkaliphilus peptidifermentans]|uniref:SipL SPOCS domain-containing protein n=1 Tax=Alkaliphilus peptidifermentans DSM 18978 TaxID=1120976 RepID=A0A1G5H2L1_9FIRM|nr:hypothetical protein [Alkaliphilus peptidifermentans]SCY58063.1 hypothetical protein SAMN03080606_01889 [Alkaliphilus peptidifermentans DSM 18978]